MEETALIYQILSGGTLIGVYIVAIIANVFPGIPEEATLLLIGYMSEESGVFSPYLTIFLVLGFLTTDLVLFALARSGNKYIAFVRKKFFKTALEGKEDKVQHHIGKIIFFSRFVLYFRWIGPVLAGWVKTSWKKFIVIDLLALSIYVPLVLWLGGYYHNRIHRIIDGINVVGNVVGGIFFTLLFILMIIAMKKWFITVFMSSVTTVGDTTANVWKKSKTFLGISKIKKDHKK